MLRKAHGDEALFGHFLHCVFRPFASHAAVLDAGEGDQIDAATRWLVDVDDAYVQPARRVHRTHDIACEDAGRQSEWRGVHRIDSFIECDNDNCNDPTNGSRTVPQYVTADVFVDYTVKSTQGTTRFSVGVNNVANADPPTIYTPTPNSDPSAYDFMGRYFYLRVGQLF